MIELYPPLASLGGCVQARGWADLCLGLWEENMPSNIMETNSSLENFGLCFQTKSGETFCYHGNPFYHTFPRYTRVENPLS